MAGHTRSLQLGAGMLTLGAGTSMALRQSGRDHDTTLKLAGAGTTAALAMTAGVCFPLASKHLGTRGDWLALAAWASLPLATGALGFTLGVVGADLLT